MTLFAGIDGGQSSTVAALGDARGEVARGVGPPADLVGQARESGRQAAALRTAVTAALRNAGLDPSLRLAAVVAGISGFDRGTTREPDLADVADRVTIVHDAETAHAGALGGADGIVVIAGTGSVALGRAAPDGRYVRAGGWGYFFGDEGGAIWIARTALRRAMAAEDAGAASDLRDAALASFGARDLRAIQHAFAHGELTRPTLAAFAAEVLRLAACGDAAADAVRSAASAELADLVATVDARLGPAAVRRVSYAGGLFAGAGFAAGFRAAVLARVPSAAVVAPEHDPAGGALLLARGAAAADVRA